MEERKYERYVNQDRSVFYSALPINEQGKVDSDWHFHQLVPPTDFMKEWKGRLRTLLLLFVVLTGFMPLAGQTNEYLFAGVSDVAALIWCCCKSACSIDGVAFDLELEDFCDRIGIEAATAFAELLGGEKKTLTAMKG